MISIVSKPTVEQNWNASGSWGGSNGSGGGDGGGDDGGWSQGPPAVGSGWQAGLLQGIVLIHVDLRYC